MENIARKLGLQINQEKTKCIVVERKNCWKQNKIGHLKIKNYKFERVENFKYLGVILNEDNNHQIDLQERIKNSNKTYFMLQKNFKIKNIFKKLNFDWQVFLYVATMKKLVCTWTSFALWVYAFSSHIVLSKHIQYHILYSVAGQLLMS
jgi:hypothetical protein